MKRFLMLPILCAALVAVADAQQSNLKGEIKADGSSTVYLISEAAAANFKQQNPGVAITVGVSGTGGGFKKFANGETDISNASRPIKAAEAENCEKNNIKFTELQVAWDGLAVVVNKENTWARKMTLEQLKKMWHADSEKTVKLWSDIDPTWPKEELKLFGPGTNSGTFDYFTEAVNGKEKISRTDYTPSEDDNTLVKGVQGNKYALGYFGLAYAEQNKDKLNVVDVQGKSGSYVTPTPITVLDRSYPLSRPLFIYVKNSSLKRPEVVEFVKFQLRRDDLASKVGYVPLSAFQQAKQQKAFEEALKK